MTEWAAVGRDRWFHVVNGQSVPSILAERLLEHALDRTRDHFDALPAIGGAVVALRAEAGEGKLDLIQFAGLARHLAHPVTALDSEFVQDILHDESLGDNEKLVQILGILTQPGFLVYT